MKNLTAEKIFTLAIPIYFVLAGVIIAQPTSSVTPEQRSAANEQFTAKDWQRAAEAYSRIAAAEPQNVNALYRLGSSLYNLKKYDQALDAFQSSDKVSANPNVRYNIACLYALTGRSENAFEWLEKAIDSGFANVNSVRTDTDLDSLRALPRFKSIEEKAERAAQPCKYSATARQFDFWVGDWDVKTQQGQVAGTNDVLLLENGCLIQENWTGSMGGTGKSFNFYDNAAKKWRQIWVDNGGNSTLFTGEVVNGEMVYLADRVGKDGKPVLVRLTFTPLSKDKVRQHGENSSDGGKTWLTTYDLVYFRKAGQ